MGKLFRVVVLLAAILAVMSAGSLTTIAPAQEKKKAAKAVGADDDVGTVEVYKAKDGWRYRVKNSQKKTIAMPVTGYESPEDAMKILNQVKATLNKTKVKVLKEEKK
jgi:uncharacterized protein YegP (UPF0339 family)